VPALEEAFEFLCGFREAIVRSLSRNAHWHVGTSYAKDHCSESQLFIQVVQALSSVSSLAIMYSSPHLG